MERKGRGEIKKVGDLFEKYRTTLKAPQGSVIQTFCEVVFELLGMQIKKEVISYTPSSKTLSLKTGGALKTEIKLHETEILTHMKGRLGEKSAPEQII